MQLWLPNADDAANPLKLLDQAPITTLESYFVRVILGVAGQGVCHAAQRAISSSAPPDVVPGGLHAEWSHRPSPSALDEGFTSKRLVGNT